MFCKVERITPEEVILQLISSKFSLFPYELRFRSVSVNQVRLFAIDFFETVIYETI